MRAGCANGDPLFALAPNCFPGSSSVTVDALNVLTGADGRCYILSKFPDKDSPGVTGDAGGLRGFWYRGSDTALQTKEAIREIRDLSQRMREDIVTMTGAAGSGHPGGSLSVVEILATLYQDVMRHDPANPRWPERDRLVLSKGHAAPALYSVLAAHGYFPSEELITLRKLGSMLQGHPDMHRTPGVEMSTGSLGMGLSVGNGMALAARLDDRASRVYVILGDGELDEGSVWESAMAAAHYGLDNLVAIVDRNGMQIDGDTESVMKLDSLAAKWQSFGWNVIDVADGHDPEQLLAAFAQAAAHKNQPTVIIAHTIKGKGVTFMEQAPLEFHGKAPNQDQVKAALAEIRENEE